MPSTVTWTGANNDGDILQDANYLGGSKPVNGDTIVFDRGDKDVTANLTSSLTSLNIIGTDGYKGRIAPGSNSLNASYASIKWAAGSANFSGNVTSAKFEPRPGSLINYASGTMASVFLQNADLSVAAAAVVTNLRAWASTITDLYNATGYTLAELAGGSVLKTKRGGKIIAKASCTAELLNAAVLSTGSEARTKGLIKYLSSAAISGTVDIEPDGVFTARENSTAFTFSSGTINYWPGARYELNTRAGAVAPGTLNPYSLSGNADAGSPVLVP